MLNLITKEQIKEQISYYKGFEYEPHLKKTLRVYDDILGIGKDLEKFYKKGLRINVNVHLAKVVVIYRKNLFGREDLTKETTLVGHYSGWDSRNFAYFIGTCREALTSETKAY